MRRSLQYGGWLTAAILGIGGATAHAQKGGPDYPTKPVRWIVPFTPGASNDIIGRLFAAKLGEAFGQQFVIDNRPGAGGSIGTEAVVRAAADGYTLLWATSPNAIAATLMAMQVADSMSVRCTVREVVQVQSRDHGYLGILYVPHSGYADVRRVFRGTPADAVGLRPGDHVIAVDGIQLTPADELQAHVYESFPGATPRLTVERRGEVLTLQPTLVSWPSPDE